MKHLPRYFRALCISAAVTPLFALVQSSYAALPPAKGKSSTDAAVNSFLADAQKALNKGNIALAIIDLKNASSAAPKNCTIRAELGQFLLQAGDYYSAERELRQARKDGASDRETLLPLFRVMLIRHEEKALLDEFAEAAANNNRQFAPDILRARAVALESLGQIKEAASAMDKALSLRRDVNGLLVRARIAQRLGDESTAIKSADEAIRLAPKADEPVLFKIRLLSESRNYAAALELANQVVGRSSTNLEARFMRVELLIHLGQDAKARAEVDKALAQQPEMQIGLYYRALLVYRAGDAKAAWKTAQPLTQEFVQSKPEIASTVSEIATASGNANIGDAILRAALVRNPQDVQLHLRAAATRLAHKDNKGASDVLAPVLKSLDPSIAGAAANLYVKANRFDDAVALLQKVEQAGRGNTATTLQLAGLEIQQGHADKAFSDISAAARRNPTDPYLGRQLISLQEARGQYQEATATADKIGSVPSQRLASMALRAEIFAQQHRPDDALREYNKAVQQFPKSDLALFGRASVLQLVHRSDQALQDLNGAIALNPHFAAAYIQIAVIESANGRGDRAKQVLERGIKAAPTDMVLRIAQVRYLLQQGDALAAQAAANSAIKLQPRNPELLTLLGESQLRAGKSAEAVSAFRRVITLAPGSASQLILGNALLVAGDRAGALKAFKAAEEAEPKSLGPKLALINLKLIQGDRPGAVKIAQLYRDASPTPPSELLLGDTYARTGGEKEAMQIYQKLWATNPSGGLLLRMMRVAAASQAVAPPIPLVLSWLAKNPGDLAVRNEYAEFLMKQGKNDEAAQQYEALLKVQPDHLSSLNNLGWLIRDKDPERALIMVRRAAQLAPQSADILDTLGWVALRKKSTAEAVTALQKAHELRPSEGEFTYHLALALDSSGQHGAARDLMAKLIASGVQFKDMGQATSLAAGQH